VTLSELYAECDADFIDIIGAYQRKTGGALTISLPSYKPALVSRLAKVCAHVSCEPVCHFKVISFARLANALMKLKATYSKLPCGEFVLGIEGYGSVRLYSSKDGTGAALCDKAPDVTLDKLTATRFLFGHMPADLIADVPDFVKVWLPLPLFWNLQDRV
jgi:hypothetical protein